MDRAITRDTRRPPGSEGGAGILRLQFQPGARKRHPAAYDATARKLVQLFIDNFGQFEDSVDRSVRDTAAAASAHA